MSGYMGFGHEIVDDTAALPFGQARFYRLLSQKRSRELFSMSSGSKNTLDCPVAKGYVSGHGELRVLEIVRFPS
jgi:hypothetical protein